MNHQLLQRYLFSKHFISSKPISLLCSQPAEMFSKLIFDDVHILVFCEHFSYITTIFIIEVDKGKKVSSEHLKNVLFSMNVKYLEELSVLKKYININ